MSGAAIAPGKLAVVTGAASGIGLAAARALVDRAGEALDAAARGIEDATAHALDVADPDALVTLAEELGEAPALLMNNAAIGAIGDVLAGVAAADRRQPDGRAPRRRRLRSRDDRMFSGLLSPVPNTGATAPPCLGLRCRPAMVTGQRKHKLSWV